MLSSVDFTSYLEYGSRAYHYKHHCPLCKQLMKWFEEQNGGQEALKTHMHAPHRTATYFSTVTRSSMGTEQPSLVSERVTELYFVVETPDAGVASVESGPLVLNAHQVGSE